NRKRKWSGGGGVVCDTESALRKVRGELGESRVTEANGVEFTEEEWRPVKGSKKPMVPPRGGLTIWKLGHCPRARGW
ncbi:unnamed protein product, partial [Staurois parvus]